MCIDLLVGIWSVGGSIVGVALIIGLIFVFGYIADKLETS
jgi:hypothetical protein